MVFFGVKYQNVTGRPSFDMLEPNHSILCLSAYSSYVHEMFSYQYGLMRRKRPKKEGFEVGKNMFSTSQ